jgi:hypothetical protein
VIRLGKFYKFLGVRHTSGGIPVIRFETEFHGDPDMATGAATFAAAVKTAYDKVVAAAGTPPPPPTIGQVILGSGKPAVIGLDADDVAAFDALGTDSGAGTLTAATTPAPATAGAA